MAATRIPRAAADPGLGELSTPQFPGGDRSQKPAFFRPPPSESPAPVKRTPLPPLRKGEAPRTSTLPAFITPDESSKIAWRVAPVSSGRAAAPRARKAAPAANLSPPLRHASPKPRSRRARQASARAREISVSVSDEQLSLSRRTSESSCSTRGEVERVGSKRRRHASGSGDEGRRRHAFAEESVDADEGLLEGADLLLLFGNVSQAKGLQTEAVEAPMGMQCPLARACVARERCV